MSERRKKPNLLHTGAASVFMAGLLAAPAAASTDQVPCPEAAIATLDVPVRALITDVVNHNVPASLLTEDEASAVIEETTSSDSLLTPSAAAAIHKAFKAADTPLAKTLRTPPMAGTEHKSETGTGGDDVAETDSVMNTKLPGVADVDLLRFKKQMYRRDI